MSTLGLALSGGGSRAMAFHRGTLRALEELGLTSRVDVVSTVSGGSVFGAAWVCSRQDGTSTNDFLEGLVAVLKRGFVRPALFSPRVLKVLLPGFSRSDRLAEVFSSLLFKQRRLADLPEHPTLVLNTTVMNHAMPGRFTKNGFSSKHVGKPLPGGSYPEIPLAERDLGFAVAASACFPFALPPLTLEASELPTLEGGLEGEWAIHLTDGGILENLGVERLLASDTFETEHIICSDAGAADSGWAPTFMKQLASFGAWALSRKTLSRLLTIMNDKQNKTMRQLLLRATGVVPPPPRRRDVWIVRIDQTWDRFFTGISQGAREALAGGEPVPDENAKADEVVRFLEARRVDLRRAKELYVATDSQRSNEVATNFTGLCLEDIEALERHAAWQVHACKAVFGGMAKGGA